MLEQPGPDDGFDYSFTWAVARPFTRCPECDAQFRYGERVTRAWRVDGFVSVHVTCLERWTSRDQ